MNKIPRITFFNKWNQTEFELLKISDLKKKINSNIDHNPKEAHRISFHLLLIITEGCGTHTIDFVKYKLKKGTVLKIATNQVHSFDDNINYDGYLCLFTENFINQYFSKSSIKCISYLYNYHLTIPIIENCNFYNSTIEQFREELEGQNNYAKEIILSKILELFLLKLERVSTNSNPNQSRNEELNRFIQFKKLLENHYQKEKTVKYYANQLTISAKQLNTVLEIMTGYPAKRFITQFVLLEAKRKLLSTDKSIKEIAYETGFEELTNFIKYFRKNTGQTPKEFKNSYSN